MPIVVSTVAQKGGVGKTTTAVALALEAAHRGFKTAFIDFDPQANGTGSFTDIDKLPDGVDGYSFLKSDAFYPLPISDNLYLIAATLDLLKMDDEGIDAFFTLKEKIQQHLSDFDLVVIDTPGTLKTSVTAAMNASNYVYSPIELTQYSIKAFDEVKKMMTAVRRRFNPSLSFLGFVPNRVHGFREQNGVKMPYQKAEREVFCDYFSDSQGVLSMISERADIRQAIQKGKSLSSTVRDSADARGEVMDFCNAVFTKTGLLNG
ncbi:MAG: ParA family protein [Taibaiella sp.]|nr:ParA family protein [Taibaiella sp.]